MKLLCFTVIAVALSLSATEYVLPYCNVKIHEIFSDFSDVDREIKDTRLSAAHQRHATSTTLHKSFLVHVSNEKCRNHAITF